MPKSTSYHEKLIQDLKNPLEAAAYIEVILEEGDPKMLSKALKNVIEALYPTLTLPLQRLPCIHKLSNHNQSVELPHPNPPLAKERELDFRLPPNASGGLRGVRGLVCTP
ncbi:hypothetical protein [Nostoc sp. NMS4]|uniref:helix-turn-helix domain-containing transcriptional regulator n=1 Tax=Nostoc sp. NMS4 TaxID=2815390 RepID=UPI0025ED162D|nr:hypothetical protein [Nostoc sp. NMS4]MBN3924827.1 hypothetical protein [Nostoc sp. NMS4]